MSESQYRSAYESGYVMGLGDGRREMEDSCEERLSDEYWCGFFTALVTWPVAGIVYVVWKAFAQ